MHLAFQASEQRGSTSNLISTWKVRKYTAKSIIMVIIYSEIYSSLNFTLKICMTHNIWKKISRFFVVICWMKKYLKSTFFALICSESNSPFNLFYIKKYA